MNDMDEILMRTTKTVLGEYSEIFVITPEEYKYVYRLALDKYFYYLTSTKPSDKARFNRRLKRVVNLTKPLRA